MSDSTVSRREALLGTAALAAVASLAVDEADAAQQRNMEAALEHLRNAKAALERAQPNKGGHRKRAISLTDEAIQETRRGIRFASG